MLVESAILEPQTDGTTKLSMVSKYDNLEDLEGMVNSGMEKGSAAGLERIAKLVEAR